MNTAPILSLCLPTNGVVEWVFPVLDSIFAQDADIREFEVVVTDNGSNQEFKKIMTERYVSRYSNLVYEETDAPLFLNEIEAYKRARGQLIKFVNHRTRLVAGAVEKLIGFARENLEKKPIVYFSNGVIEDLEHTRLVYPDFDCFVKNLSYWSSWSTGMTFWKSDFDRLPEDTVFNYLFPHTTILFQVRDRDTYIIDNTVIMDEIPAGNKPKGKYDLFYAFAVEYPGLLLDLLRSEDITPDTFRFFKQANLDFLARQYYYHVIRKAPCSYDLSTYDTNIRVFYSRWQINKALVPIISEDAVKKLRKIFGLR